MLKTAIDIALVYFVFWAPVILVFLMNLLFIILKANPHEVRKVREMIRLAEAANKGDIDAQIECEGNTLFKRHLCHGDDGFITRYSVPRAVRLAPFMNQGAGVD